MEWKALSTEQDILEIQRLYKKFLDAEIVGFRFDSGNYVDDNLRRKIIMNSKLDKFGEICIAEIYDNSIADFEMMFDGRMKGMTAQDVRHKTSSFSAEQKEIVLWLISKSVEKCIHKMLFMLEEHNDMKLLYEQEDITEISDGLTGELYSEDGWIKRFSKYVDVPKMGE